MRFSAKSRDLKREIAMNGYSISSFAKELGLNVSFLNTVVNGHRHTTPTTAKKISDSLSKNISDLFEVKEMEE
ncbi:XRE family transcriptional regulator [Macrococcoides bohemicum]|uniref:helix-turn-helix domain-containing protein n=1 Tax=Macrococcoides bohemicum TaxID=1903056 RepID=UPI00105AA19E|nr:helix-turn-helix transcriptional regulator [Macrococcus bohemicus]TDL33498.1 XRE family transcriptional regulator [Macrococcus bohemicus]